MSTTRLKRTLTALAFASGLPLTLVGCWGGDGADAPAGAAIGGSVAGLSTAGLVLANGNDTAIVAAGATSFTFPSALAVGASYAVTVQTQPANESCVVTNGSGTVRHRRRTVISVTCQSTGYTVGGSIAGLTTAGLVLANGADSVSVAANAIGFTLPTPVPQGAAYVVA